MTIDVRCVCGKHLMAPDTAAGKKGKCPTCGRSVLLPDPAASAAPGATPAATAAQQEGVRGTCVITDSDARFLKTLVELFREHGYEVLHATSDSNDAIDNIRELRPDVVVLDEKLRPMSGFRVIQALTDPANPRNRGVWDHIYVMTSDKTSGREKQYALSLGVEIFVQKPFTPVQVFPRLERRLAHKKH